MFQSKRFLCLVCNPGHTEKSQRFINKQTWNAIAHVPLLIRTFLCKSTTAPQPDLIMIQQCLLAASRHVKLPVIIVAAVPSDSQSAPSKHYRVVFRAEDNAFLGSLADDCEMAVAAWTVLCRQSRSAIKKSMQHTSSYTHGKGLLSHTHTFSYQWKNKNGEMEDLLVVSDQDVHKYIHNKQQPHHVDKLASYKNVALVSDRPKTKCIDVVRKEIHSMQKSHAGVSLSYGDQFQLEQYIQAAERDPGLVDKWQQTYQMMEEIYDTACKCTSSEPYRMHWLDVYTSNCSASPSQPCGVCRGCRTRMAQAAMVVFAAQGVSDKLCLARLGAVFRHPRYENFSLEEWCCIDVVEFAACFKCCSKHCKNAFNCYYFLKEILENGPPTTLEDLVCFRSVQKKTACLWLVAVYQLTYGIPVDSHVNKKSVLLGLVPEKARDKVSLISTMLEYWIDVSKWEMVNNLIGGISQFMENDSIAALVIDAVVQQLSREHVAVLKAFCNKRMRHSILWQTKITVDCSQGLQQIREETTTLKKRSHLQSNCGLRSAKERPITRCCTKSINEATGPAKRDNPQHGEHRECANDALLPTVSTPAQVAWIQTILPGASICNGDTRLPGDKENENGSNKHEKLFVPLIEPRQQTLEEFLPLTGFLNPEGDTGKKLVPPSKLERDQVPRRSLESVRCCHNSQALDKCPVPMTPTRPMTPNRRPVVHRMPMDPGGEVAVSRDIVTRHDIVALSLSLSQSSKSDKALSLLSSGEDSNGVQRMTQSEAQKLGNKSLEEHVPNCQMSQPVGKHKRSHSFDANMLASQSWKRKKMMVHGIDNPIHGPIRQQLDHPSTFWLHPRHVNPQNVKRTVDPPGYKADLESRNLMSWVS